MIDGIINVYKEQNYTSFDVVAKLRGILKQKRLGIPGHWIQWQKVSCWFALEKQRSW